MRISRKVRDTAILALEVAGNSSPCSWWSAFYIAEHRSPACRLTDAATNAVLTACTSEPPVRFAWLEAAALLRDGWSPGDPVVRR